MKRHGLFLVGLCALSIFFVTACGLPFALSPTDPAPTAFPTLEAKVTQAPRLSPTPPQIEATQPPLSSPAPPQPRASSAPDSLPSPQGDATAKVDSLPQPKGEVTSEPETDTAPGAVDSLDDIGGPPPEPEPDTVEPPSGSDLDDDALPTAEPGEEEPATSLMLINDADQDVCYVLISPSDSETWGDDWLDAGETIPPGWTITFYLEAGTYDLMAQACDGGVMGDIRKVDLDGEMQWTITEDSAPQPEPEVPAPRDDGAPRAPVYPTPTPASVSEFLCCGTTPGETGTIWSVNYPANWFVTLLPNNPQQFYGALFTDPQGKVTITFIPGSNTEPGNELDTGNVDDFLNRYVAIRQREEAGYEEVARNPLPGVPSGRLWVGTWGSGADRGWEAYLVTVDPMLQVAPGLPQGYLTMYGFRAPSSDWANAERTFDQMWNSMRVKKFGGNEEGLPPREPNQKPVMIRWCPKCCDWVAVEADHEDWGCPHCGRETELWETLCE